MGVFGIRIIKGSGTIACWLWKVPCLPVKPWQITFVFLSIQTLAVLLLRTAPCRIVDAARRARIFLLVFSEESEQSVCTSESADCNLGIGIEMPATGGQETNWRIFDSGHRNKKTLGRQRRRGDVSPEPPTQKLGVGLVGELAGG